MNIKIIDLETSPNIQFSWHLRQKYHNYNDIIQEGGILSAAWKDYGSDYVYTSAVDVRDPYNDYDVVYNVREALEDCDLVITQNGDKFDLRKINAALLKWRLDPLPPIVSADCIKITRREFALNSYGMDAVRKFLGLEGKTKTEYDWWKKICTYKPVPTAERQKYLDLLVSYNADDVNDTEEMYEIIKPYSGRHPSLNLIASVDDGCPTCGSTNLRTNPSWIHRATTRSYARYRCDDCKSWCRSTKSLDGVNFRSI